MCFRSLNGWEKEMRLKPHNIYHEIEKVKETLKLENRQIAKYVLNEYLRSLEEMIK